MSVREKLLSTDLDAWSHPGRVMAFVPLLAVLGTTVGYFAVPHVVESRLLEGIGVALFGGLVVFLGSAVLAVFD